jgi:hypothetical protein
VVDLAERQPVADGCDPRLLPVGDDVRGVEEFAVPQRAYGAPGLVGAQHRRPEHRLVQPLLRLAHDVPPDVLVDVAAR